MIKEKLDILPTEPGCYMMYNCEGIIIYVGKAKNLKNRVKSYFTGAHNAKTTLLVSEIVDFEFIITTSELEALVLEINLIKQHLPKYNIRLVDDKTYPYILLTNETYPRLMVVRQVKNRTDGKYFGPYPNVSDARSTTKLLNSIYPLRKCTAFPKKECLYYHMHQCLGPCIREINYDFSNDIAKITSFLKGNTKEVMKILTDKMNAAVLKLDYEAAINFRDLKESCEKTVERQKIVTNDFVSRDVIGIYQSENDLSIEILYMRQGSIVQNYRTVIPYIDKIETLTNFLAQYYQNEDVFPKEIIINDEEVVEVLAQYLKIPVYTPIKGKKKELVYLAYINAKKNLLDRNKIYENRILKNQGNIYKLGELLNIKPPIVIEAFDNSNIFGEYPVSAMVAFKNGIKSPKDYRKYHVKTVNGSNDYETMKEVVYRRYFRVLMENSGAPDLIIMDGGEIQINACLETLKRLNLSIPVMGLKKDKTHTTNVIVYKNQEIVLSRNDDLYLFLANIQQTVHDFAISFFRKSKTKGMFASKLDGIRGLGPKRKEALLKEYITLDKIRNLTEEEFRQIGINKELSDEIVKRLREINKNSK